MRCCPCRRSGSTSRPSASPSRSRSSCSISRIASSRDGARGRARRWRARCSRACSGRPPSSSSASTSSRSGRTTRFTARSASSSRSSCSSTTRRSCSCSLAPSSPPSTIAVAGRPLDPAIRGRLCYRDPRFALDGVAVRAAAGGEASLWTPGGSRMMLKGKVALVTGAARGIGREIALLMARQGALVVVNDYGGTESGAGGGHVPADEVVSEITRSGGQAGANYDSVASMAGGQAIVRTAVDAFGRIDIVVNNAGILRDRMIFNMTEEEWDAVIDTHLKGSFAVTRAAAPLMREQKWGRFINMTSTSGLVGNVGQANYAAAKLGIVGLTKVTALDMGRYNVTANCISPFAWTRLIGKIPTETEAQKARVEKIKTLSPAHIAPVAAFLCTNQAKDITGQIFGVRGKEIMLFSHMRPIMRVHHAEGWTPARLAEMFPGTLQHHCVPLDTSGQYFNYDPLV